MDFSQVQNKHRLTANGGPHFEAVVLTGFRSQTDRIEKPNRLQVPAPFPECPAWCMTRGRHSTNKCLLNSPFEMILVRRIKVNLYFSKSLKNKIIKIHSPGDRQNFKAECGLPCFAMFKNHIFIIPELPESRNLFFACVHTNLSHGSSLTQGCVSSKGVWSCQ